MTKHVEVEEEKKGLPATSAAAVPANLSVVDYGDDAGAGFENQTSDDVGLPFIDILQGQSPEVLQAGKKGARAGEIINRNTGETWDGEEGIIIIPAITEHCYTEWKPRKGPNGEQLQGGFVARHELTEEICQKARAESPFKAYRLPNGNDLLETFYTYCLQISNDGSISPIVLAFTSTKIKSYKTWMTIARSIMVLTSVNPPVKKNPPLFAHRYKYTTKLRQKDGNNWFIPVIGFAGASPEESRLAPNDPLYQRARDVRDAFQGGTVKADYKKTTVEKGEPTEDGKAPF